LPPTNTNTVISAAQRSALDVLERIIYTLKITVHRYLHEKASRYHGRLLHTDFWSHWQSRTTLIQLPTPYSAALPTEHVRAPRLFSRRSYFMEVFTGSSLWSNTESWQF